MCTHSVIVVRISLARAKVRVEIGCQCDRGNTAVEEKEEERGEFGPRVLHCKCGYTHMHMSTIEHHDNTQKHTVHSK